MPVQVVEFGLARAAQAAAIRPRAPALAAGAVSRLAGRAHPAGQTVIARHFLPKACPAAKVCAVALGMPVIFGSGLPDCASFIPAVKV